MKIFLIVIILLCVSCLYKDNLSCYNQKLAELKKTKDYKQIFTQAHFQVFKLKNPDSQYYIKTKSIDSLVFDSALFFNKNHSKCLLLVLQRTNNDYYFDYVQFIQGSFKKNNWVFSSNRLPNVSWIKYGVHKKKKGILNINNSFSELSKKGRLFVLNAGTVKYFGCDIDNKYWFDDEK